MTQVTEQQTKLELPNWFILQAPPDIDIQVAEWLEMAIERLRVLLDFQIDHKEALREFRINLRADKTWIKRQVLGSFLLRLAAASHGKISGWLIETEGDLFEHCYRDLAKNRERESMIRAVTDPNRVRNYYELRRSFPEIYSILEDYRFRIRSSRRTNKKSTRNDLIAIHFTQIPWMVSQRKGFLLYKGWLITDELSIVKSIKKLFEDRLKSAIEDAKRLIGVNPVVDDAVRKIIKELEGHSQIMEWEQETFHFTIEKDAYLDVDTYPPCMRYLYERLLKTGRLPHAYRVQFGAFLKRMGMDLETQLDFWYNSAIDNVNITKEQFLKFAGYQIRHLYGLEGGRKDYEVPKCSTAIASYFCLFTSLRADLVTEFLRTTYPELSEKQLEEILRLVTHDQPKKACSLAFTFTHSNQRPPKGIHHPLMWVRLHRNAISSEKKEDDE